jgi:NifU-like protein involved in Fe-S cluster formation
MNMSDQMVADAIASHAMNPQRYGILESANAIGQGVDPSGVYLFLYLLIEDDHVKDCRFATNGSQDAITLASMLSEMIVDDTLSGVHQTLRELSDEVERLYAEKLDRIDTIKASGKRAKISLKEQDNAAMVLAALRAALQHYDQGGGEKFISLSIEKRGGSKVIQGCVN